MTVDAQPLISVIIPLKNRRELIVQTLASVQGQTWPRWEAIVVDDHSTDDSLAVVAHMAETEVRIHCFRRQGNQAGGAACRNEGLAVATGKYVVFLDSDDLLAPWALQQRVEAFRAAPDLDAVVFPMLLFNRETYDLRLLANTDTGEPALDRFLRMDHPWLITGPLWKREFLVQLGGFNPQLPSQQDYDLHVRALLHGLRYQLFSERPDSFYRQETTHSGTRDSLTAEHLHRRKALLQGIVQQLRTANALTPERRRAMAGNFLFLAQSWRFQQPQSAAWAEAKALLALCATEELLAPALLGSARRYLRFLFSPRLQRFRPLADQWFRRGALETVWPKRSATVGRVRYEGDLT